MSVGEVGPKQLRNVRDAIVGELRRQGVTNAFGLLGSSTLRLLVELDRQGIRYFNAHHESAAVGMADGYARVSGDVGVAILESGPGLTNGLTALITASKAGSRVVALAGDSAVGLEGPAAALAAARLSKHVDQAGVIGAAGIRQVTLRSPDSAIADLAAAFECARLGATVLVNLPTDVQEAPAGSDSATVELRPVPARSAPDPEAIRRVADLLGTTWAARHPVILAGRGAVHSEAKAALVRLGEMCGALMATTLFARSLFAGDPYEVGICGTLATPVASELLPTADVVLAFGASLNPLQTFGGELFPKAVVAQFDTDRQAFGRWSHAPDLAVVGDVRLAAVALVEELARRGHRSAGYRTPDVAMKIAAFDIGETFKDGSTPGALDPRALRLRLEAVLPKDRCVVCDVGHHFYFTASYLSVPDPRSWICFSDCAALGSSPGVALGAAVARPDRPTVLSIGDGGAMMNIGELETAVRYRLPVVVLVMNDAVYGAEVQTMRVLGLPDALARLTDLSFESIGRALGADAVTVRSLDDVTALAGRFEHLAGPLIVDCKVSADIWDGSVETYLRLSGPRPAPNADRR